MGYFTDRIFQGVTADQLQRKVKANLALYEPGTVGREVAVNLVHGHGCVALEMGYLNREEEVLRSVAYQLGGIWMDVRYQDGDCWDLSVYKGAEHMCSHSVNPWAHEVRFKYNQDHVDYRINKLCKLWPAQAERMRPYLLPWREPVRKLGLTRFVARKGKAYPTDEYTYGDADQIHDFLRVFGIDNHSVRTRIGPVL